MSPVAKRSAPFMPSLILLAMATVCATGCSGRGTISGTVKFKDQPLPTGRITFLSEVGKNEVFQSEIKDGAYSIKGVPAGPVKVRIETPLPVELDASDLKEKGIKTSSKKSKVKVVPVPAKYGDFKKSGLGFEVTSGSQTKDFDLKP